MAHDVASVGLTILDVLGRPVERIPEGGNVEFIDEIRLTVAGTAAGTVIDMAKLGLKSLAVGAVGDDEKGDFVIQTYKRYGVDTAGVQRIEGVPTSATILNVRPNGDRPALHVRGASDHFTLGPGDYDAIGAGDYVHMGGNGLLNKFDGEPTVQFLKAMKERGCTTTYDLIAPTPGTLEILRGCLAYVDYFMPSMEEAVILSGKSEPQEIAKFFLGLGAGTCIFKWGGNGSFIANADGNRRVPAFKVDVVDTTGCGDAYCAGFTRGLKEGWDIDAVCRFATAASGLVATGLGSDAGIVDFQSTVAFMQNAEILEAQ
ncbi:MAG: carbohydrate kinase family protein [Alphaproteobacteria bacterium]